MQNLKKNNSNLITIHLGSSEVPRAAEFPRSRIPGSLQYIKL